MCGRSVPVGNLAAGALTKCPACQKDVHVPVFASARAVGELRCPKCTKKVEETDRVCAFCQTPLPGPNTRRMMAEASALAAARAKKLRPLWIALLSLWTAGVLAFLVWWLLDRAPAVASPVDACRGQLAGLQAFLQIAVDSKQPLPASTGSKFWSDLVQADAGGFLASCPTSASSASSRYRGPARPYASLPPEGIVACDPPSAHRQGVNVLLKNGSVVFFPSGSPDHERAFRETAE
jgi:hypothetical protein